MGRAKKQIIDGKLLCSRCEEWVKIENFSADKKNSTGFSSQCKKCHNESKPKLTSRRRGVITSIYSKKVKLTKAERIELWTAKYKATQC